MLKKPEAVPMAAYAARRTACLLDLTKQGGVLVVRAADLAPRSWDAYHPFIQDSHFYYLTGFDEPEAVLVLVPGRPEGEVVLFCRPRDADAEQWDGPRAGLEGACATYGADEAFSIHELAQRLPALLDGAKAIHYPVGDGDAVEQHVLAYTVASRKGVRRGAVCSPSLHDVKLMIQKKRLIKSDEEVALLRYAIELAAEAHCDGMRSCKPGQYEYELESVLVGRFMRGGARQVAYEPIVAAGDHACVLHYTNNDGVMHDGEMVLVDAGGQYAHYISDITRTYPVNGRFTDRQKAFYSVVLEAQKKVIKEVKPGSSIIALQKSAVRYLTEGLIRLGLLKGEVDRLIQEEAYRPFYMHLIGHWIGLDTHDPCPVQTAEGDVLLEPNMLLTVEPGLYVRHGMPSVDEAYWGMGVRIEDNILVTESGCEVLSNGVPKEVEAIEAMMASGGA